MEYKIYRLGKCAVVPKVDRAGIGGERIAMKQMRNESTILRVPSARCLIRLAEGWVVEQGYRIKLTIEENLKPENSTAPFVCLARHEARCAGVIFDVVHTRGGRSLPDPPFLRTEQKPKDLPLAAVPSWSQPRSPLLEPYRRSFWQLPTHVWSHQVLSCEWCNF